jgi:hypothetical protein
LPSSWRSERAIEILLVVGGSWADVALLGMPGADPPKDSRAAYPVHKRNDVTPNTSS